jgi:hypothetical protein
MADDGSGEVVARVKIRHYAGGAPHSVFGLAAEFVVLARGKPARDEFMLQGVVDGRPDMQFSAYLVRRAELPS